MKTIAKFHLLALAIVPLVAVPAARAAVLAVPALTFANPAGQAISLGADSTVGWSFTLSTPMTVGDLGFHAFAPNSTGAAPGAAHEVAIWNASGTRIADGTVPAGTGGTDIDGTYYVSIAPVSLSIGTYTIGAFVPSNTDYFEMNDTVTTIPGVTYNGGRSNFLSGFTDPTGNQLGYTTGAYFGPDFEVVPEPSTWALLGLGGAGLLGLPLRRRRAVLA